MESNDPRLILRPALAKSARLQTDPITGDPVLLYPEGVLVLNPTAHAILAHADGRLTVGAIVEALAAEYEAPASELTADVLECLRDLQQRRLVLLEEAGGEGQA